MGNSIISMYIVSMTVETSLDIERQFKEPNIIRLVIVSIEPPKMSPNLL